MNGHVTSTYRPFAVNCHYKFPCVSGKSIVNPVKIPSTIDLAYPEPD